MGQPLIRFRVCGVRSTVTVLRPFAERIKSSWHPLELGLEKSKGRNLKEGEARVGEPRPRLGRSLALPHLSSLPSRWESKLSNRRIGLCDNLSVVRNYFLGREVVRRIFGVRLLDKRKMGDATRKVSGDFGLRDSIDVEDEISLLSGGEKQTFKIARAVSFRNRVIIMDEPTNHPSVRKRGRVNELAVQLKEQGLLVIYITHDIFQIHRIARMSFGWR
jgi:ABC-type dipeptide/oligopeptide/nickel transport system ATPase subunit